MVASTSRLNDHITSLFLSRPFPHGIDIIDLDLLWASSLRSPLSPPVPGVPELDAGGDNDEDAGSEEEGMPREVKDSERPVNCA